MININFSRVLPKIPRRILRQSTFKKLGIFILFKKIEFSLGGGELAVSSFFYKKVQMFGYQTWHVSSL